MVGAAQQQFQQHVAGGRVGAGIVKDEVQQAVGHGIILCLTAVALPGLDGPGQDFGEIDLAQMQFPVGRPGAGAQGGVGAQHVQHRAAGGVDDLQGLEADADDAHVRARMFGTFHEGILFWTADPPGGAGRTAGLSGPGLFALFGGVHIGRRDRNDGTIRR